MLPDRVSNPGPLTDESGALPIAQRGPAMKILPIQKNVLVLMTSMLLFFSFCFSRILCSVIIIFVVLKSRTTFSREVIAQLPKVVWDLKTTNVIRLSPVVQSIVSSTSPLRGQLV